jgi:predicted MFS family arabinose efflux permease
VRPFFWWFASQVTSASGLMTQLVAVGWLVLRWHGNGFELGLLSSAGLGPTLVLGLWAGSLVDHHDRRTILIWTQSLLAAISLALYALIASGAASYWPVIAITLATGTVNSLDAPARQIYVLDLVGPERLAGAVSLYEVILNLSRVLGPAIGGTLLAISGPAACVLVNSVTFLAPLTVLLIFRPTEKRAPREAGERRPSAMAGLRYAWSQPLLRACMLIAASCGVLFSPALFFPLLATRVFHMGGSGYGLLLALFGIGALPGALLASRRTPSGIQVRTLAIATGFCVLVTATAPDKPVLFAGILGIGACSIWMVASANTLVQLRAAPELRGRVMGAWTVALPGTIPITALLAGGAADLFGPRIAYGGVGVVIAGVALGCWGAYADPPDG